jgi:hypothetical protein
MARHTIVRAALVERIFGRGLSTLGGGGGRAAVCGDAASLDNDSGMTVGGESARGGCPGGIVRELAE